MFGIVTVLFWVSFLTDIKLFKTKMPLRLLTRFLAKEYVGRKVWMLAKLPEKYIIGGERIEPFMVFSNSHDGSTAIKVCMTPVRIVCMNTLNLALKQAKRTWSAKHTGNIQMRMHEARETLGLAHLYMEKLGVEFEALNRIKLTDSKVLEFINELIPLQDEATAIQQKNIEAFREDMKMRYFDAPDLKSVGKNGYRFICAASDFGTHAEPLRETTTYKENLFLKTMEGHPFIDKAYAMVKAA
jgi:phage/plasmid-like protein (TIGR03299 family)